MRRMVVGMIGTSYSCVHVVSLALQDKGYALATWDFRVGTEVQPAPVCWRICNVTLECKP